MFEFQVPIKTVLEESRNTLSLTLISKSILDLRRSNDLDHKKRSGGAKIFLAKFLAPTKTVLGVV